MGTKQRGRAVWKAPSLTLFLKLSILVYALCLSLRLFTTGLYQSQSTSSIAQQLLEEFSISPTRTSTSTSTTTTTTTTSINTAPTGISKSRARKVLSAGRRSNDRPISSLAGTDTGISHHQQQQQQQQHSKNNHDDDDSNAVNMDPELLACLCRNSEYSFYHDSASDNGSSSSSSSSTTSPQATIQALNNRTVCFQRSNHSTRTTYGDTTHGSNIWNRDPRRIPTYVVECPHSTFFGYVFRDLVNRLFPPKRVKIPYSSSSDAAAAAAAATVADSSVSQQQHYYSYHNNGRNQKHTLIVSNDAARAALDLEETMMTMLRNTNDDEAEDDVARRIIPKMQYDYGYNVAASIYLSAKARGYKVTAVNSNTRTIATTSGGGGGGGGDDNDKGQHSPIDDWWGQQNSRRNKDTVTNSNSNSNSILDDDDDSELLLLFLDPSDMSQQDNLITNSTTLLGPKEQASMIDYVVFRIVISEDNHIYGTQGAMHLLELGYHLQILSASHAFAPTSTARMAMIQPNRQQQEGKYQYNNGIPPYGPNKVLATPQELQKYFQHFRTWAATKPRHNNNNNNNNNNNHRKTQNTTNSSSSPRVYSAYLFATKTMDMAIPSAQEHINLTGIQTADVVLNVDGDGIPYQSCPGSVAQMAWTTTFSLFPEETTATTTTTQGGQPLLSRWNAKKQRARITATTTTTTTNQSSSSPPSLLSLHEEVVRTKCAHGKTPREIWFSGSTPETSEMACVECPNPTLFLETVRRLESTTCITRFLPALNQTEKVNKQASTPKSKQQPNILFLLLEQVSRDRFEKFMPMTRAAIVEGGLERMDHYTATSTIPKEQLEVILSGGNSIQPIHSLLDQAGYVTFSAGNGCNATVLQNAPNVTLQYGSQLNGMMCRQLPSRPNCIGDTPAVQHLLDYSSEFLTYHSKKNKTWAAFLSFVEGQEETGILPGTIDKRLSNFITRLRQNITTKEQWDNTLIIVASDTGATHGSFAQSFAGQREMVQPVLYLKATTSQEETVVKGNRNRYMTPYDLHRTIEVVASGSLQAESGSTNRVPLLTPLPETRLNCKGVDTIPQSICDLLDTSQSGSIEKELSVQASIPPSILSFYADMPKQRRAHVHIETKRVLPIRANVTAGCQCATNVNRWFECNDHPWTTHSSPTEFKEFFMLVDCPDQPTHLELRVVKNNILAKRVETKLPKTSKPLPNIVFLELDSVSGAFADRHFPKTREFLQRFRVHYTNNGTYECSDGICSADFTERITLAGANSIPNQVAALSGCLSSGFDHSCGHETPEPNLYCRDPAEPHYGLQMHRVRMGAKQIYWCPPQPGRFQRLTPWMFGVTDSLGYVNYFGEEFCYEGSPYVTQGNVFPAFFSDISPHLVFCRLAELRIQRANVTVADEYRWGYEKQDQACVDSDASDCIFEKARISLDLMEQVWNIYAARPKFAFLNVLAAHVYNADWSKVFLAAERYDEHLSAFLEKMVSRDDFENTMIIIRSDHGLQRGPTAMNYNLQVEHTRPWTEILVPESLPSLSKKVLFENQNRLTSGYDLYHTIRSLMEVESLSTPLAPLANWTYDLLSMPVPSDRTCKEARVDEELCRERSIVPSFGICNALESQQGKFCRKYKVPPVVAEKDLPKARTNTSKPSVSMSWQALGSNALFDFSKVKEALAQIKGNQIGRNISSANDFHLSACDADTKLSTNVTKTWSTIDDVLAKNYSNDRVSGGIFLYPRQASLLTTLVQTIVSRLDREVTLCETGFGSGHSLALFAHAVAESPHPLRILSFDKFDRKYQLPIWKQLNQTYPFTQHHLDYVAGDSCRTVPALLSGRHLGSPASSDISSISIEHPSSPIKCDILHGSSLCRTDNIDLVEHAPCGALLTSTAMGSLNDHAVYFGPKAQWRKLRDRGCITPPICFQEDTLQLNRTFVFAQEGSAHAHQFCIAMTTGTCRPPTTTSTRMNQNTGTEALCSKDSTTDLYDVVSQLGLSQFCPRFQIPAPL